MGSLTVTAKLVDGSAQDFVVRQDFLPAWHAVQCFGGTFATLGEYYWS